MTKFLLIRHATTDYVGQRLAGRMPGVHLNETGQKQAQQLVERLSNLPVTAIYSSPLERCVETASPLAAALNVDVCSDTHFLEIDFGDWTNCTFEELSSQPSFQLFNSFRSGTRIPGGEFMREAQMRIISGIEQLSISHLQETVAIISHSDMIKAAIAYYAGMPLDLLQRIEISPVSVSIITLYKDTITISRINDTGELKI